MVVLVVNAGSSSLKLTLLDDDDRVLAAHELSSGRSRIEPDELRPALDGFGGVDAVGHRIVHGGSRFVGPVQIDAGVVTQLRDLADLAPLHQAKSLGALEAVARLLPGVPAVACFDTAFHHTMLPAASTYALPHEWRERFAIPRYGFHGLSHAYVARRAAQLTGGAPRRLVSCHLGAGASLAAIRAGRSVDTTMGFTPLDGLVMATRSGSIDPGLILWLLQHAGFGAAELADALEHRSGLLGLTGTADMRTVLARAGAGDPVAELGREVYLHRLRAAIAAMAATLGGVEVLVFTGGVGERSAEIRQRAVEGLGFLGLAVDRGLNAGSNSDGDISGPQVSTRTLVIRAREDLEIAAQVRAVLGTPAPGA